MKLNSSDWLAGGAGLVWGGPLGAILSPVTLRALKGKKRSVLWWALIGVFSGPICWILLFVPIVAFAPETPQQIAIRERAEKDKRVAELKAERARVEQEEKKKFASQFHIPNPKY